MSKSLWITIPALLFLACGGESTGDGSGGSGGAGTGGSGTGGGGNVAGTSGSGSGATTTTGGTGGGGAPGGGGASSGGASSGGAPGGGGAPCASLQTAYVETIAKAKVCNPAIDSEQCTAKVPNELECPCGDTHVNPGNTEALKNLNDLTYFWNAQKCGVGVACPDIACQEPKGGACQPDSSGVSGSCQDVY